MLVPQLVLGLTLVAAAVGGLPQQADAPWSSIERESWVRTHALRAPEELGALEAALGDSRWLHRAAALEALRRAWEVGTLPSNQQVPLSLLRRLRELASDAEAPERATALAALAQAPVAPRLTSDALDAAAEGPPAVLLALSRLLEFVEPDRALPRLARLCEHPDERVRDAALDALAARGDGAREIAAAIAPLARDPSTQAFVVGLVHLERSGADSGLLEELSRRLRDDPQLAEPRRSEALAGVEAVRLVVHDRADLGVLVQGWSASGSSPLQRHALLLRAARAAHAAEAPLCEALLDAASRSDEPRPLLEGAVQAAAPQRVVALARERRDSYDGALGAALWTLLLGRAEQWAPATVANWLEPDRDADLRGAVVDVVAATLGESGDVGSAQVLVEVLHDADTRLAEWAFQSLCAAEDPDPWLSDLHAAWRALSVDERVARLRWLPRDRPLEPFREDLVEHGERDLTARAQCADLLAPWHGEREVAECLARWLLEDVHRLEASGGEDVDAERRAVALVRALGGAGLSHPESGLLTRVVEQADERTLAVAKTAVAVLASKPGADSVVQSFLENDDLPNRLRIEAALQLAPTGNPRALAVLDEAYDGCDPILRARAVRAAAVQPDPPTTRLLRRVAFDPAEASELRRLAIDGLAAHGKREPLMQLLAHDRHPDVRDAAITGLGVVADAAAQTQLLRLLAAIETRERRASTEELTAERESLLVALAACGAWSPELQASWFVRPLALARGDLAARLRGEHLAPPPFRFRGELALASSLASRAALGATLQASGTWWQVDGRLLGHAGVDAMATEPHTAEVLLQTAWIALAGEDDGQDGPELRFELRRRLLAASEARRDWSRVAALTEGLLADWRARRVPGRAFEEVFGPYDPVGGVDPRGRLESAVLQARAWQAHEAGGEAQARSLAGAARIRLGASSAALRAQETLEAALGGR